MLRRTGVKWDSRLEFGLIDVEREGRADVPIADTGWTAGEGVEGAFEGVQRPPETDAVFFVDIGELGCFAADVEAEGEGVADGDAAECPRAAWSGNLSELMRGREKKRTASTAVAPGGPAERHPFLIIPTRLLVTLR
jgi:hypothetical protein